MLSLLIAGAVAGSILAITGVVRVLFAFLGTAFNAVTGNGEGNR